MNGAHIYINDALAAINEVVPILVADMETGEILHATHKAEKLFGYIYGEMVGICVDLLVPPAVRDGHPAHRARYAEAPATRPMGYGKQLQGVTKTGVEFPIAVSLAAVVITRRKCVIVTVISLSETMAAG